MLTYVSYAKGFKAGGFNLDRTGCPNGQPYNRNRAGPGRLLPGVNTAAPFNPNIITAITANTNTFFKPEYSDSIEAGAKGTLFDRKLLLNATLFYEKFSNFQYKHLQRPGVRGGLPARGLQQGPGHRLPVAPDPRPERPGRPDHRQHPPSRTATGMQPRACWPPRASWAPPGSRLPLAPAVFRLAGGDLHLSPASDYMVRFNLGTKFNSKYNTGSDEDPRKEQTGYFVTDGRIIFGPQGRQVRCGAVWAENLFNTNYEQVASSIAASRTRRPPTPPA